MVLQQIAALTFNLSLALLGAEVPLSANVELVPAAYSQAPISAATNGGDFLVLWKSEERLSPARPAPRPDRCRRHAARRISALVSVDEFSLPALPLRAARGERG